MTNENWNNAVNSKHDYTFTNGDGWEIVEPIYGDLFLSNLYEWEYTPADTVLDYTEMLEFIEKLPGFMDMHYPDAPAYRGLEEPTSWAEYDGAMGNLMLPPGHRNHPAGATTGIVWADSASYWQMYRGWCRQIVFFTFLHRYHAMLEKALGLPLNHLCDVAWSAVSEHIELIADYHASYADTSGAEAIADGIAVLDSGYELAHRAPGDGFAAMLWKVFDPAPTPVWHTQFFSEALPIMNPRMYYVVKPGSAMGDPAPAGAPDYPKPFIELTWVGPNWTALDTYGSHWVRAQDSGADVYIQLVMYTLGGGGAEGAPSYSRDSIRLISSPGHPLDTLTRVGFVSTGFDAEGLLDVKYHSYPGGFTAVDTRVD